MRIEMLNYHFRRVVICLKNRFYFSLKHKQTKKPKFRIELLNRIKFDLELGT